MLSTLKSGEENKLEVFVAMCYCIVTRLVLLIADKNNFVIELLILLWGCMLFILKIYDLFAFFTKKMFVVFECSSLTLTRLLCCGLVRGEGLFYYP